MDGRLRRPSFSAQRKRRTLAGWAVVNSNIGVDGSALPNLAPLTIVRGVAQWDAMLKHRYFSEEDPKTERSRGVGHR
ncbi:MAG: hypothetical protein Q8L46_02060 [candidate division WWE3 bacterium]|nr:hypothetical protein [candidate division WWE3 bacterium]